jgi:hypothetical protein
MMLRKSYSTLFALCLAATAFGAGCSAERSTMVTRTTAVETAPPPGIVAISIVGLHDEPSADPYQERVVGTIINNGDKPVSRLSVQVNALDSTGNIVDTITTPPLEQTISPMCGQARFEAQVPKNPAVTAYHAVAVAR